MPDAQVGPLGRVGCVISVAHHKTLDFRRDRVCATPQGSLGRCRLGSRANSCVHYPGTGAGVVAEAGRDWGEELPAASVAATVYV